MERHAHVQVALEKTAGIRRDDAERRSPGSFGSTSGGDVVDLPASVRAGAGRRPRRVADSTAARSVSKTFAITHTVERSATVKQGVVPACRSWPGVMSCSTTVPAMRRADDATEACRPDGSPGCRPSVLSSTPRARSCCRAASRSASAATASVCGLLQIPPRDRIVLEKLLVEDRHAPGVPSGRLGLAERAHVGREVGGGDDSEGLAAARLAPRAGRPGERPGPRSAPAPGSTGSGRRRRCRWSRSAAGTSTAPGGRALPNSFGGEGGDGGAGGAGAFEKGGGTRRGGGQGREERNGGDYRGCSSCGVLSAVARCVCSCVCVCVVCV